MRDSLDKVDFRTDTTRAPRGAEQDGVDYFFITVSKFEEMIKGGGFIEHAKFGSNYYGTSFKAVEDIEEKGQVCVLDIEMEVSSPFSRFALTYTQVFQS